MVSQRKLFMVSLVLALTTALLVYAYVRAATGGSDRGEMVAVLVAKERIPPRSTLQASMLTMEQVPREQVHADAMYSLDEAVGRLVKETILEGELLRYGRLYSEEEKPGLTFVIPPGKRAVSVAVNEVIGVAGFIKPGDRVDVLSTFDAQEVGRTVTVTVLQDVEVLAISQRMEDKKPDAVVATTATLALSLDEAEKITLAEERGRLRLVLRPAGQLGQEYARETSLGQLTAGKGKGLEQVVPGAKPPAPAVAKAPATEAVAKEATAPSGDTRPVAPAATSPDGHWSVELIRGVSREVVKVDR